MIIYINKNTRRITLPTDFLGVNRENLQDDLIFKFEDEFVDGTGRLEVIKNDTVSFIMLEKENESYITPISSSLLTDDRVLMQLVITQTETDDGIPVFKSKMFFLKVSNSINAEEEEPEEYPEWIDTANAKLSLVDDEIEKVQKLDLNISKEDGVSTLTITKKDGTTKEVEIKDGVDGVDGNNGANGSDGKDAKINGINTLNIVAGENLTSTQVGSTFTINANKQTDNNYTTEEKNKLSGLNNYDDTSIKTDITEIKNKQTTDESNINSNINEINSLKTNVNGINDKIPTQATNENKLADKDFVNSSINSVTAFYITKNIAGNQFETKAELDSATTYYSGGEVRIPTRNDYAIVRTDETHDNVTARYIYHNAWEFQYVVNGTALTSEQIKAINSGITTELVTKLNGIEESANNYILPNDVVKTNNKVEDLIDGNDYVKNTDYATTAKGGTVKINNSYAINITSGGNLTSLTKTYNEFNEASNAAFISKGTLVNVIAGKNLVDKSYVDNLVGNIDTSLTSIIEEASV